MRRAIAACCVCWLGFCGATKSNVLPLRYGMTPKEAALALGLPLAYYSGHGGSKIYVAVGEVDMRGTYYPVDTALALQFRRNRLTGWKQDWQLRRYPFPF